MPNLLIPRRFNGPPRSGNGGWTAGALVATLPGGAVGEAVTVTLRLPPPLDVPMELAPTPTGMTATYDGRAVAEAARSEHRPAPVLPVPAPEARAAEASYAGLRGHPFPGCFVCGPEREPGDGLRIFPGAVGGPGEGRVAATWTPEESDVPLTWAALDCTGGWASGVDERPAVLGRITVEVRRLPEPGETHVVVGEVRDVDGRKTFTAATLYGPRDEVVAAAEHTWIAVDPKEFS